MSLLSDLFVSGWIAVVAIAVLWLETVALCLMAPSPLSRFRALLANAMSGTCLLAAVGVALRDGHFLWIAALMGGSLLAHGLDVVSRLSGHAAAFSRRTE